MGMETCLQPQAEHEWASVYGLQAAQEGVAREIHL